MRKLIALMLCLTCVFSVFTGCSNSDTGKATSVTTEPTVITAPEFTYKMAPIHKEVVVDSGYTELWIAIEMTTMGWQAASRDSFVITNSKTNEVLNELGNAASGGVDLTYYVGNVCQDDHAANSEDLGLWFQHDCRMYVIKITSANDINFEDLSVVCTGYYLDDVICTDDEDFNLVFNADISEITTQQDYIHGETLFEQDGKYYVSDVSGETDDGSLVDYLICETES